MSDLTAIIGGVTILNGVIVAPLVAPATQDIAAGNDVATPTSRIVRITSGGPLTGFVAPTSGLLEFLLRNVSGVAVTISHEATSTAANRFDCPTGVNYVMADKCGCMVAYSPAISRWVIMDAAIATGGGGSSALQMSQHIISADFTITADKAAYVPGYVEIAASFTLEIGLNADLEIG